MHSILQWLATNIGSPCGVWMGHTYMFVLNNPSEIKIVLNHRNCYEKATIYERLKFLFRNSIILVSYDTWKHRRRFYQKSYSPNAVKSFFSSFYKQSCNFLMEIEAEKKDLLEMCNKYAFTNFLNTSVDLKGDNLFTKEVDRFGKLLNMIQDELSQLILDPISPTTIWYNFYPSGRRARKYLKEADNIVGRIIHAKKKEHTIRQESPRTLDDNKEVCPLLDLIMEMLSYDRVFEELLLFATAGTDASGVALSFTFVLLGMHPQVQDAIYDEVISTIGDGAISYENLPNLLYTEAAICESMRLLPPVPYIGRKVSADTDIGTRVLPKGIDVAIDIFRLHRDPKYWHDPLKFDPTRFLPENASKIQPYSYLPFSAGPKNCMGKRQAMTLLKVTVANIVRKFTITSKYKSVEEIKITSCITMGTTHPLDCHFSLRLK